MTRMMTEVNGECPCHRQSVKIQTELAEKREGGRKKKGGGEEAGCRG